MQSLPHPRRRRPAPTIWVVDEIPHYTGPIDPRNRNIFGACLSLVGLATMVLALLLLLIAESNRALVFKLEAGFFPPFSESAVQSARTEVVVAAVLTVLATASALTAVIFRSNFTWRLIGGVTLLTLILVGPLLWVCYDMAF
jgi:hypothetical protein